MAQLYWRAFLGVFLVLWVLPLVGWFYTFVLYYAFDYDAQWFRLLFIVYLMVPAFLTMSPHFGEFFWPDRVGWAITFGFYLVMSFVVPLALALLSKLRRSLGGST